MKTVTDQSPESTDGETPSEITEPPIEVGKAEIEGEKVEEDKVDEEEKDNIEEDKVDNGRRKVKRLADPRLPTEEEVKEHQNEKP